MNTFGQLLRLTTAGESHGPAITAILDGFPAGITIDFDALQATMNTRRPGQGGATSPRCEHDHVELLSGVFDGVSTGSPITISIANTDVRSADYEQFKHIYRPSHADFTYQTKYGIRDYRGGGRASARETALRVAAGALAQMALDQLGIKVFAYTSRIGSVSLDLPLEAIDFEHIYDFLSRCPHADTAARMDEIIQRVRQAGDTVGGIVSGAIAGLPAGLGQPVYHKFHAMLASAMMSINAAKGFEVGMGFEGACRLGSAMNDPFALDANNHITTLTNHSGGVQGGITTGRAVTFRVAFKPVATLAREFKAITDSGQEVTVNGAGRHDVCVVPRAVAVVKAMAALTTLDAILLNKSTHLT